MKSLAILAEDAPARPKGTSVYPAPFAAFVAGRENGRIQKFDLSGKFLGEYPGLVKPMTIARADDGTLVVAIGWRNEGGNGLPWLAWIVCLDPSTGKLTQAIDVRDDAHGMALMGDEVLAGGTTGPLAAAHAFPLN